MYAIFILLLLLSFPAALGAWHLLDGDKLATLCADFLMEELAHLLPPLPAST